MSEFKIIAITPPSLPEPSIAISATRAGGLGVLDLEYTGDIRAPLVLDAISTLAQYAKNEYGIKLSIHALIAEEVTEFIRDLPKGPDFLILTQAFSGKKLELQVLKEQVQALHDQGLRVLWEAVCLEEAQLGEQISADGIIAKGHESGGRIGEETTYVLLQRCLKEFTLPIYAQGGIGLHTASACYAVGAAGVVLDSQLLLTRESPISEDMRKRISLMDGSETSFFGESLGESYRVYYRPNLPAIGEIQALEKSLSRKYLLSEGDEDVHLKAEIFTEWRQAIVNKAGWDSSEKNLLILGQDVAFAAPLAESFATVGGILEGIRQAVDSHVQTASDLHSLDEGSPLAQSLGIRYPIFQGPMARISDTPSFAAAVADAGGFPFLAISLMPADELRQLLEETHGLLGDRPWGVGLIGFLPPKLFSEQIKVICECHPPFALIAGGRPKQNQPLEAAGIPTYMHVPSTGLLDIFLQNGQKRFILEGRESGGHVGPRTSFVLWEAMIDKILERISKSPADAPDYHVLFAGGIHDALSASMIAVMSAPLAQLGVRIGVQMGTAYLFTEEIVQNGGITHIYQKQAIDCDGTVVLEVGPGQANRCICTPFAKSFYQEKQRLQSENKSPMEIRFALEQMSIGGLYTAAKGTTLVNTDEGAKVQRLSAEEQLERGTYMIGQIGAMKNKIYSIETLHHEVSVESTKLLEEARERESEKWRERGSEVSRPVSDIAIIGIASVFPKARSKQEYWENILNKVDTKIEVPMERWDWKLYYDPDPRAKDKVYSKWGCFLDDVIFDPLEYGMPPKTIPSIEPLQLIALEMVREALKDAGYDKRPFPRERTSVILGAGGSGAADLAQGYGARSTFPMFFGDSSEDALAHFEGFLPEWTEDSFAGILMNVAAGRIANRFDLGGENYTVDAACASSMAALHLAVKELNTYNSDMVIVGGADTMQSAFTYLAFSKTMALSPTGESRTMDEKADGIVLGEGIGFLILKRLEDAERDGDRIYAVIKAVGSSSDGRDKSMTAPRPEGQALALRRAYQRAGISPSTVELIEAHGTGTVAGDRAEIQALSQVFNEVEDHRQYCAIGSVKSMIGHTKCTAGIAGVIKTALSLYHKVLPPTIGVDCPNSKANFPESPFYVNTETRPWIDSGNEHPRRAGTSAFGFGGTNFHTVLEEYTGYENNNKHAFPLWEWPSELFIWKGNSRQEILSAMEGLEKSLQAFLQETNGKGLESQLALRNLAFSVYKLFYEKSLKTGEYSLAIIARSVDELRQRLIWAQEALRKDSEVNDPRGIYYTERPLVGDTDSGKIAFLFPGQGSQYVNMLMDLVIQFPEVRVYFERANRVLKSRFPSSLSGYIFPQPWFTEEEKLIREQALKKTNIAQPAVGVASIAMFHLLETLGLKPDFAAGHSYGEYIALCAAGVFDEDVLVALSEARGRFIVEAAGNNPGKMAAINADAPTVSKVVSQIDGVCIANENSPEQTVITGTEEGINRVVEQFGLQGVRAKIIPVACAFHSPIVASARKPLVEFLSSVELSEPKLEVFSNTTANIYPREPNAIIDLLADHLVKPVEFVQEISAMYEAGARIFVEVGPRSVLTRLTSSILSGKPHLAVASDQPDRNGIMQLQYLLGQLAVHGIPIKLDRLYQGREVKLLDLNNLPEVARPTFSPTAWLVNCHRAKPISKADEPEPIFPQVSVEINAVESKRRENGKVGKRESGKVAERVSEGAREQRNVKSQYTKPEKQTGAIRNESHEPHYVHAETMATDQREQEQAGVVPQNEYLPNSVQAEHEPDCAEIVNPHIRGDGVTHVMMQYQQLMSRFLDTQKSVMLAYLQSNGSRDSKPSSLRKAIASRPSSIKPSQAVRKSLSKNEPVRITSPPPAPFIRPESTTTEARERRSEEARKREIQALEKLEQGESDSSHPKDVEIILHIPNKAELTGNLLQVVSERTGYPTEMLDLDLDMEADLGIDSIKRIEILASLQDSYDFDQQVDDAQSSDAIEELASLKTLRGIIEWLEKRIAEAIADKGVQSEEVRHQGSERRVSVVESSAQTLTEAEVPTEPSGEQKPVRKVKEEIGLPFDHDDASEVSDSVVNRYTLVVEKKPIEGKRVNLTDRVLVLTDDKTGVASGMIERLQADGRSVALVRMGGSVQRIGNGVYVADITRSESVAEVMEIIRQEQGPIGGFIHLLPLNEPPARSTEPGKNFQEMDITSWEKRLRLEIKSLFYFAKELGEELKEAASSGDAFFMAATAMGGTFASAMRKDTSFFPGQGGITGFLKTVAREWIDVRIRAIDLSPDESTTTWVNQLMSEISLDDGLIEVGYSNDNRYILVPESAPVDKTKPVAINVDSSWVILVTGGARGITSDVAIDLAQRYQPTLLLVGRSALPDSEESLETSGLAAPRDLKAAIMERMRSDGEEVSLAKVEEAYSRLLKDREMRENIAKMRSAGAKIHYYQADVCDEHGFSNLINEIYETYGRLDGVIHGAGIIEDKLIRDKTPQSFDRVFDTKVNSAFILSRELRAESLSFFVIFSSVAGRFGNRGQSDYAAANEVYCKLAIYLDKLWTGRVVSVIWGPWARSGGMVSAELEKQFAKRGIHLVPSSVGPRKLDEELRYGRKGEVEVIIGGGGWAQAFEKSLSKGDMEDSPHQASGNGRYPLIDGGDSFSRDSDGTVRLVRKFDTAKDVCIKNKNGSFTLPMAVAMELMAEVVSLGWPDLELSEMSDLHKLQEAIIRNGRLDIQVTAKYTNGAGGHTDSSVEADVSISPVEEPESPYYRAKCKLQNESPAPSLQMSIYLQEERPFPVDVEDIYRELLPQNPIFQRIAEIKGMGTNGILGILTPSSPKDFLINVPEESARLEWIMDPFVIEGAFQLITLWAKENLDIMPSPKRILRCRKFSSMSSQKVECQVHIQTETAMDVLTNKVVFFGEDGHLLGLVEGLEFVDS